MKTVIMAGGKGTRIASVASDVPKPMLTMKGKPILEHEILSLRKQGFDDLIITVGHLSNVIMDYFGDGKNFGVNIEYFVEETPLGNAGALFRMKDKLKEDFLLLNGDVVFDVNFQRFIQFHNERGGLVTLFTHPNNHPYDSGLIITDENKSVVRWLSKEDVRPKWYENRVNAGLHVVSPRVLEQEVVTGKVDLDRHLLKPLAGSGQMFCYDSTEYVKDMGTPERYRGVCRDFHNGIVNAKNLLHKQKAVFLDRDGTINRHVGFLRQIDDFQLLEGAAKAIKAINESGYLAIVVTNQPVIARGEVTVAQLKEIHNKMETQLGEQGAYIDAIYYCPHHPDRGFDGEIQELKVNCDCRKPKPGMLLQAARDYNIDLSLSWMIGDSGSDVKAGLAAGCHTYQIEQNGNLQEAVEAILGES